jgi:hypothetical protein
MSRSPPRKTKAAIASTAYSASRVLPSALSSRRHAPSGLSACSSGSSLFHVGRRERSSLPAMR